MTWRMAAALVVSSSTAAASSGAGYWTPAQTSAMLTSGTTTTYAVRLAPGGGGAFASGGATTRWSTARCSGLGKSRAGGFTVFSCELARPSPNVPTLMQRATMFARPWSRRAICISDVSQGSCPAPAPARPAAHDPRVCGDPDQAKCVIAAVAAAISQALAAAGGKVDPATGRPPALACRAGTVWTAYSCTWASAQPPSSGTVSFVLGRAGWSAKAALAQ